MTWNMLAEELAFFEEHRLEWCESYRAMFALVQGRKSYGFYGSFEEAVTDAYRKIGLGIPFLIKEVLEHDRVHFVGAEWPTDARASTSTAKEKADHQAGLPLLWQSRINEPVSAFLLIVNFDSR